jgi:hypothetical protein
VLFIGLDDEFFASCRHGDEEERKNRSTADAGAELGGARKRGEESGWGLEKSEGGKEEAARGS